MTAPAPERQCPFCDRLQLWAASEGVYFHWSTNEQHCDAERLAHWDSAAIRKELG